MLARLEPRSFILPAPPKHSRLRPVWRSVESETEYNFWKECGIACCVYPLYRAVPYANKHIVGISGRAGAYVDQLTLHYSDGSSKTNGQAGGSPVPIQQWDPAVDGHITKVEYDPSSVSYTHLTLPTICSV